MNREPTYKAVRYQRGPGGTWHEAPNGATEVVVCDTSADTENQNNAEAVTALIGYGPKDRASSGFQYRITLPATAEFTIKPGVAGVDEPTDEDETDAICSCGDPDCSRPAGHADIEPAGTVDPGTPNRTLFDMTLDSKPESDDA